MFINWVIGFLGKIKYMKPSGSYPMVLSIHEGEIEEFLNWMRNHTCSYTENIRTKKLLKQYTNEEIIMNGLVSAVFEEYGDDLGKKGKNFSITLFPSSFGTEYKLKCACGKEFVPSHSKDLKSKTA